MRVQSVVLDLSAATFIDAGGVRIPLAADTRFRHCANGMAVTKRDRLRPARGRPWM